MLSLRSNPLARQAPLLAVLITCVSCGGGDGESGATSETSARTTPDEAAEGTLVMNGERHSFMIRTCDLMGVGGDDVILRGLGTMDDGRRFRVELERMPGDASGAWEVQNVFVMLGDVGDREVWSAKRHAGDDGNWYKGEISTESAPGPLIEIDENSVSVAATLEADGDGPPAEVEIEAECL